MHRMRTKKRSPRAYRHLSDLEDAFNAAASAVGHCAQPNSNGPSGPFSLFKQIGQWCTDMFDSCGGGGGWEGGGHSFQYAGGGWGGADTVRCGNRIVPRGRKVKEREWGQLHAREKNRMPPRKTVRFNPAVKVRGVLVSRFPRYLACREGGERGTHCCLPK